MRAHIVVGLGAACMLAVVPVAPAGAAPRPGPRLEKVFDAVNEVRAEGHRCGAQSMPPAPRLRWNPRLGRAADRYAGVMARRQWFSHVGPSGATLTNRSRQAGYRGFAAGENIASGQPTARSVVAAWLASPGHCRNIMNRAYDEVGLGFAQRRAPGSSVPTTYWVQDFGMR